MQKREEFPERDRRDQGLTGITSSLVVFPGADTRIEFAVSLIRRQFSGVFARASVSTKDINRKIQFEKSLFGRGDRYVVFL